MILIPIILLLAPGLISVRSLWRGKVINSADYKFIACDYIVYSFLIMLAVYAFMFFTYPERTVSFSIQRLGFDSHIYSASFVFKYSLASLAAALILPSIVSWLGKMFAEPSKKIRDKKKGK